MAYRLEAITLCTRGPVNTSAMRELWGDIEQGKLPILFDSEHNFAVGVSPVLKYSDYSVDDKSKFTLSILVFQNDIPLIWNKFNVSEQSKYKDSSELCRPLCILLEPYFQSRQ